MRQTNVPAILVSLTCLLAWPAFGSHQTCADRSMVASAVRTAEDVRTFVQCAYEMVQEVGAKAARRAFHEEERWRSGPIHVFVDENTANTHSARAFVYPPDPSREGVPWGLSIDAFGNDLFLDAHRMVRDFGEGWLYNSFHNPTSGRDEPKVSYIKGIDWEGVPAFIGAGIYGRDIPGTCHGDEVNAGGLEADPSPEKLQEFVRCAALDLESQGHFGTVALSTDPRWRSNSIYVFGLDTHGNTLFTGHPYSRGSGLSESELDFDFNAALQGRDVASVADTFGESFLYYWAHNPSTGLMQRKRAFVKRVVIHSQPVLVGAGVYVDCPPARCGTGSGASEGATAAACKAARAMLAELPAMRVKYGFYSDFNPMSYSIAPAVHQPMGYEPDLVAAVETLSRGKLSFSTLGIGNPFSGIWLKAAQDPYDMVGGGITALPGRTRDANGRQVIRFGVAHVSFRQSLLVRAGSGIYRHADLTAESRVGVLRGTTGEKRLLELTGIIDARGFLRGGTQVQLAGGDVLIAGEPDGGAALRIAAGTGSAAIATRVRLTPAGDDRPEVLYFNSDSEQLRGLLEGEVDALARGELGNRVTARDTPGLRVTAIDTEGNEWGAFSYPDTPAGKLLRRAMNAAITCLTANGTIGFSQWFESGGTIFSERAGEWR